MEKKKKKMRVVTRGSKRVRPRGPVVLDPAYVNALSSYWEGRHRTALERASQAILNLTSPFKALPFYRLWLEVLSEGPDHAALESLGDHFLALAARPVCRAHFMALKGLTHFYRDEIEAVKLILHALRADKKSPYYLELQQKLADRLAPRPQPMVVRYIPYQDYFHAEAHMLAEFRQFPRAGLPQSLEAFNRRFPGSPMPLTLTVAVMSAQGIHSKALIAAERLLARFPAKLEYAIQVAYLAHKTKNYARSVTVLTQALRVHGNEDADIFSLLGNAQAAQALVESDAQLARAAEVTLQRAITLYQADSLPIDSPQRQLRYLQQHFGTAPAPAATTNENRRCWLVEISPARFHRLKSAPEAQIRQMRRAMGSAPQAGDMCFVVSADPHSERLPRQERHWRLGAIYEVSGPPEWHPLVRMQTRLRLVVRPKVSIPIPVYEFDKKSVPTSPRRDPERPADYGLYDLSGSALSSIQDAIKQYESESKDLLQRIS